MSPILAPAVTLNANISQGTRLVRGTQGDIDESYTIMRFQAADDAAITEDTVITHQGVPSTVTQVRKLRLYGRLLIIEATTT